MAHEQAPDRGDLPKTGPGEAGRTGAAGTGRGPGLGKRLLRLATTLVVAVALGRSAAAFMHSEERRTEPAGLVRGLLHGAFMPLATPTLLLGHDAPIYAASNTGRTYKVGYTLGVNVCGLLFFGVLFWRAARWRKN